MAERIVSPFGPYFGGSVKTKYENARHSLHENNNSFARIQNYNYFALRYFIDNLVQVAKLKFLETRYPSNQYWRRRPPLLSLLLLLLARSLHTFYFYLLISRFLDHFFAIFTNLVALTKLSIRHIKDLIFRSSC